MHSQLLYFKSGVKTYSISSNEPPHSQDVEGLQVSEKYWPRDSSESQIAPGVQNYEDVIEATVSSRAEATQARLKAFDLTRDLDRSWTYVCGEPLHPALWSLNMLESPEGWITNAIEVDTKLAQLEQQPYCISGTTERTHWLGLPLFPLKSALEVIEGLRAASEATQALVDLHYGALKSLDLSGQLFLFAKGLELGAEFLGNSKKERQKALAENVRSALNRDLNWLFNVSNNRFDIRHVVKDKATLDLHPKLTGIERRDFIRDANLIIRSIVCQQIGRTPLLIHDAIPSEQ